MVSFFFNMLQSCRTFYRLKRQLLYHFTFLLVAGFDEKWVQALSLC
jgi:hypothetical protein